VPGAGSEGDPRVALDAAFDRLSVFVPDSRLPTPVTIARPPDRPTPAVVRPDCRLPTSRPDCRLPTCRLPKSSVPIARLPTANYQFVYNFPSFAFFWSLFPLSFDVKPVTFSRNA
jgi:hypothetical protein